MIVREIMTTKLITVTPDDTLSHAVRLLKQYQFHHLPVVQPVSDTKEWAVSQSQPSLLLRGLVTTEDIDLAIALAQQEALNDPQARPWMDRTIREIMRYPTVSVTPLTSVAAAAQLLVEQGINYLPVIEPGQENTQPSSILVGMLTRSDLLLALTRLLGAGEPGTEVTVYLEQGQIRPLADALSIADELHIPVYTVITSPYEHQLPQKVLLRLGTIYPTPFLHSLQKKGIHATSAQMFNEELENHD